MEYRTWLLLCPESISAALHWSQGHISLRVSAISYEFGTILAAFSYDVQPWSVRGQISQNFDLSSASVSPRWSISAPSSFFEYLTGVVWTFFLLWLSRFPTCAARRFCTWPGTHLFLVCRLGQLSAARHACASTSRALCPFLFCKSLRSKYFLS